MPGTAGKQVQDTDHSELPFASVSKRVLVRSYSYENEFRLQIRIHFRANRQTRFHMNGFALRLVMKQRYKELANGLLTSQY